MPPKEFSQNEDSTSLYHIYTEHDFSNFDPLIQVENPWPAFKKKEVHG